MLDARKKHPISKHASSLFRPPLASANSHNALKVGGITSGHDSSAVHISKKLGLTHNLEDIGKANMPPHSAKELSHI